MNHVYALFLSALLCVTAQAQDKNSSVFMIGEIGQKASQVATWFSYTYRNNPYYSVDVKYNDGDIADVIVSCNYTVLRGTASGVRTATHYVMEGDTLAYCVTQFFNISLKTLEEYYNNTYVEENGFYIIGDNKYYVEIYLSDDGYPTAITKLYDEKKFRKGK